MNVCGEAKDCEEIGSTHPVVHPWVALWVALVAVRRTAAGPGCPAPLDLHLWVDLVAVRRTAAVPGCPIPLPRGHQIPAGMRYQDLLQKSLELLLLLVTMDLVG